MKIHTLTLENFRNYEHEKITFGPYTNVIYGDNAQGKTNLLEAVCLFSYGRSKRAKSDSELIRFGQKRFGLKLSFSDSARDYEALISLDAGGKKNIKINNIAVTKLSQLLSYLNVVMFSPSELDIVKGSPAVRRRFLDEAISQLYPKYVSELSEYHKALEQKNGLLKILRQKGARRDAMLSVWNEQLAAHGAAVSLRRRSFLEHLSAAAEQIQMEISGEILKIDYTPSIDCGIIEEEAVSEFYQKLENGQSREIDVGASLLGVQRDDIKISIGKKEAKLFASQGQQRTAVLALKLAQTEYIFEQKGEYPVLLLDDIMSELDISRRQFLYGRIKDKQVLLTTTDAENTKENKETEYYRISGGRLY